MADALAYWPSSVTQNRAVFRDSAWSDAIGDSIFHAAPVLPAFTSVGDIEYDFDEFSDYSTSNYTETLNTTGTVALSTSDPGGVVVLTSPQDFLETSIIRYRSWFLHDTRVLYHATVLKLSHALNGALVVGLIQTDTEPILTAPSKGIYFFKNEQSDLIQPRLAMNSPQSMVDGGSGIVPTITANLWTNFAIVATTTSCSFYFGGNLISTLSGSYISADTNLRWTCSVMGNADATGVVSVQEHQTLQG